MGFCDKPRDVEIRATPNPDCPECQRHGSHHPNKHLEYHPLTGHGTNGKTGCSCGNEKCPYHRPIVSPVELAR